MNLKNTIYKDGTTYRVHTTKRLDVLTTERKQYVTNVWAIFKDGQQGGERIYNTKQDAIAKHDQVVRCLKEGSFDYR